MTKRRVERSRIIGAGLGLAVTLVLGACGAADSGGDASADLGGSGPSGTTTTAPPSEPIDTFEVFATRDPFDPPFDTTPVDTGGGGTTPTTSGGGGGGGTTTPTTSPSFDPDGGQVVSVLDVFESDDGTPQARVQVGSTVYTVGESQVFADSYRVVDLDPDAGCGTFLFGDTQFELCEGEQVIK
ncbi:MAG TPA: hypothetical protein VFZ83_15100 [Acidimicrobiia bacterium]|nr:hypothetical protein [Acidimicrobiia bacterium]